MKSYTPGSVIEIRLGYSPDGMSKWYGYFISNGVTFFTPFSSLLGPLVQAFGSDVHLHYHDENL